MACFFPVDRWPGYEPPDKPGPSEPPQEPPQDDNDCFEFAAIVAQLAVEWTQNQPNTSRYTGMPDIYDASDFRDALQNRFNAGPMGSAGSTEFSDSGFKVDFQDGSNQVRHYVFAFRMGFAAGSDGGRWVANGRERLQSVWNRTSVSQQDIALNRVAARHGAAVYRGHIRPNQLADAIRRDICA